MESGERSVAYFTKEVNPSFAELPLKFNDGFFLNLSKIPLKTCCYFSHYPVCMLFAVDTYILQNAVGL